MPFMSYVFTLIKNKIRIQTQKCFDSEVNKLLLSKNEGSETGSM